MMKLKPYRSRAWLSAVHELDACVLCGAHGVQAAQAVYDEYREAKEAA